MEIKGKEEEEGIACREPDAVSKIMNLKDEKCVMLIDAALPLGIIANTAAILGVSLGRLRPEMVGQDVTDRDGRQHRGIVTLPVPILSGTRESIRDIRRKLYEPEFAELIAVDFTDLAQGCRTYDEYIAKMDEVGEESLGYLGIAVCGNKKKVNKLTGSIPLLR